MDNPDLLLALAEQLKQLRQRISELESVQDGVNGKSVGSVLAGSLNSDIQHLPVILLTCSFNSGMLQEIRIRSLSALGYGESEIVQSGEEFALRYLHPEDLEKFQETCAYFKEHRGTKKDTLVRLRHKAGYWSWIHVTSVVFETHLVNGDPKVVKGIGVDVSALVESQTHIADLHTENARLKSRVYDTLSKREKMIVELVTAGKSSKEIAQDLHLSHYTVDTHRKNIMKKLGVQNAAELVNYAMHYAESVK